MGMCEARVASSEAYNQLAVATTASLLLYQVTLDNEKVQLQLRQTIYPPSVDITAVSFRAARSVALNPISATRAHI
jgi:hypothetical protein